MSFTFLGDSNVDRFWVDALNDRKEMKKNVSLIKVVRFDQISTSLDSISSGNVVLSLLTNPTIDHVESIEPASKENLEKSVSTILSKILEESIYPFCFRLKESKVSLSFFFSFSFLSMYFILSLFWQVSLWLPSFYLGFSCSSKLSQASILV
jgi:hypothetical protein